MCINIVIGYPLNNEGQRKNNCYTQSSSILEVQLYSAIKLTIKNLMTYFFTV